MGKNAKKVETSFKMVSQKKKKNNSIVIESKKLSLEVTADHFNLNLCKSLILSEITFPKENSSIKVITVETKGTIH